MRVRPFRRSWTPAIAVAPRHCQQATNVDAERFARLAEHCSHCCWVARQNRRVCLVIVGDELDGANIGLGNPLGGCARQLRQLLQHIDVTARRSRRGPLV